jgi:hypothetical protein
MPESILIVDPELPQSSGAVGAVKFPALPSITISPFEPAMDAPSERMQASVLAQSAPVEKFRRRVAPSAIAPSIAYRCEMLLSPGRRMEPRIFWAGRTTTSSVNAQTSVAAAQFSCLSAKYKFLYPSK